MKIYIGILLMKVVNVKLVGRKRVFDISVKDVEHYVLENGVVTHNTAVMYSANQAFIISKAQEKVDGDVIGWNFTINVEKSRFVKEKSKLTFLVTYDNGISKYSGLIDLALESGHVIKPKNGWYAKIDVKTGELIEKNYRLKDTQNDEFWNDILHDQKFKDFVSHKFKVSTTSLSGDIDELSDEDISEVFSEEE